MRPAAADSLAAGCPRGASARESPAGRGRRDTRPHGSIGLHDGLVHSCNAYFAQLAVALGPQPLIGIASKLRIPLTADGNSVRGVRDALPQVGYGQAQVVTSPLRIASVAAAIADNGVLRAPYVDQSESTGSRSESILDPAAARQLAGYMREVVTSGTGRSLSGHPAQIAGKTGTAEVAGRPSHAWFTGTAPYGAARKRIAFAVVIEHAGYGGASAAPAAGEIVSAAAAAGLIGK
jgi:peptidoglycan glycosyltransferase